MANSRKNLQQDAGRKVVAIAIELDHSESWHQDCYQGILDYGKAQDWLCVVDPYLVGMGEPPSVSHYAGVVGRINQEAADAANAVDLPIVNHLQSSPVWTDVHNVFCDTRACARMAMEHLVASGYRRFATLGKLDRRYARLACEEVDAFTRNQGLAPPIQIDLDWHFESQRQGVASLRRTLTQWVQSETTPVATLSVSPVFTRYLAQICSEMGKRVPQDVGIVSLGGDTPLNSTATPSITAIQIDYRQVGYEAAATLDQLMQGKAVTPSTRLLAPVRLIARESTDVFLSPDPLISQAMRYLAEHWAENPSVDTLAGAIGVSRRTLERSFEQTLGRSIHQEIRRVRADHIQQLLLDTDDPISKIAYASGFENPSYFTQFFSREVGMSPSAYRKTKQQKQKSTGSNQA